MKTKAKIMIVDDAEMNREILMVILGDEYEYVQAENGRQAIHILQQDMNIRSYFDGYYDAGNEWLSGTGPDEYISLD